jgi:predicted ATPase
VLLGRDPELAALETLLAQARLVTVTGVGGVGKTTLAMAAQRGVTSRTVCELAGITHPEEVAGAVGAALGYPSLPAALVGLADAEALVLLDNCEHVLDAAADVVARLLRECPQVTVLATSRERLELPEERVLALQPLPLPAGDDLAQLQDSPAVALLLARARAAGSQLTLDDGSAEAIASLCRRLDGLPLALELAAARTISLTPAEILVHLDDRHDLLRRRRSRGPERHRSLEAALGWSHARLPDATRVFFDRLGVFAGRFTAEEAAAVAGEPGEDLLAAIGHLDHLVAASLVTAYRSGPRTSYGLLDTLRAYAQARLEERGELVRTQDRWVDHLAKIAARVPVGIVLQDGMDSWHQAAWARVDVPAAVRLCLEHDRSSQRAARLVRQLGPVVYSAPVPPLADLGERLLARWPDRGAPEWAEFAAFTALAQMARRETERAATLAGQVLDAAPSPFAAVLALRVLWADDLLADRPEALRRVDDAIALAERAGERGWVCELRTLRAGALAELDRVAEAADEAHRAQADARELHSPVLMAWATLSRASLLALRDRDAARTALAALRQQCRRIGIPLAEGASGWGLAGIALVDGSVHQAARSLRDPLEIFVRIGGPPLLVTLRWAGATSHLAGDPDAATLLLRAAGTIRTTLAPTILERAWLPRILGSPPATDGPEPPLRDAVALARRVLDELAAPAERAPGAPPATPARFVREGDVWTLTFAGTSVRLTDAKGLGDLATLLARPGREVHCTKLVGGAVEQPAPGPLLDLSARRAYEARIVELQADLAEAEDNGDRGRADAARLELDLLVDHLAAATGLGGRTRRPGGTTERARTSVSWRVRAALRRIERAHPALAAHLRASVRIGVWSQYRPDDPVAWEVDGRGGPRREATPPAGHG